MKPTGHGAEFLKHESSSWTLTPAVHGPDSHCNFYLCIRHFFVHFSLPPVRLCAALSTYSLSPRRKARISARKKRQQTLLENGPKRSRRRGEGMGLDSSFSLYPPGFASRGKQAPSSSSRQHPHRHLPPAATAALLWQTEAEPRRGRGLAPRRAPGGGTEKCRAVWRAHLHAAFTRTGDETRGGRESRLTSESFVGNITYRDAFVL